MRPRSIRRPEAGRFLAGWRRLTVGADASPADPDLPQRLAFAFRGVLSFWTAGELPDEALRPAAHAMARALLPGGWGAS